MSQVLPKNRNSNTTGTGTGIAQSRSNSRMLSNRRLASGRHVSGRLDEDPDASDIIHFQENKHTILTNFEEWIRLSTDNKITSKNSWNFALIDYFHDLNVIKDGDKINFQRASATLDGCVKIYSSRVESAATETGKLLSGLSNKHEQDANNVESSGGVDKDGEDDDDDNDENDDGDGNKKKLRKINRIVESTLVNFDSLKIKKLDQELNIDPLFKKALSEFDEGGAKSLLLNTLNIDSLGRVIFDATTKSGKQDEFPQEILDNNKNANDKNSNSHIDFTKIDILLNVSNIDSYTICPSINQFQNAIADFSQAKGILQNFNNKYINANDNPNLDLPEIDNDNGNDDIDNDIGIGIGIGIGIDNDNDIDIDNDIEIDNDDILPNQDNNDGINHFNKSYLQQIFDDNDNDNYNDNDHHHDIHPDKSRHVTSNIEILDRDLMAYFDDKMKIHWKGPEHWKVSNLKNSKNFVAGTAVKPTNKSLSVEPQSKKKNQPIIINFFDKTDIDHEDLLFEEPKNQATITKKNTNGDSYDLPNDIKYNSSRLINLFQKPQISIIYSSHLKNHGMATAQANTTLTDENFFAEQYKQQQEEQDETERFAHSIHQAEFDEFNNDFGGDDGYNGIDFNDALNGDIDDTPNHQDATNKLFKPRNEFINFSRVAKRVDIKLLKDNIWGAIQHERENTPGVDVDGQEKQPPSLETSTTTNFANVVSSVSKLYEVEARKELSTSFCFICLLHLANEHSLTINANEYNDDLVINGF